MSEDIICDKINELEDAVSCEVLKQELIKEPECEDKSNDPAENSTSISNTSSSSASDSSKLEEINKPPIKKRRRKRHPKKKKSSSTTIQSAPDESFKARYKKLPVFINSAAPKVHLRFDEQGNADEDKSEYNYKPRIIKALIKNMELHENLKNDQKDIEMEVTESIEEIVSPHEIISLEPRIIKAIGY